MIPGKGMLCLSLELGQAQFWGENVLGGGGNRMVT